MGARRAADYNAPGMAGVVFQNTALTRSLVRLFDEVQARTLELSESLEQQTASSEVLQVISSSTGELEPVFQAMLANATRICGAKFGMLYLWEGDAFRAVAFHNVPPAFMEVRKRTPFRPGPNTTIILG